jgi:chemotaxis protein CheX
MKVEFVQPFLDAMRNVLSTMAQLEAIPNKPFLKTSDKAMGDVTGMVGMTSQRTKGSLAISFTAPAIFHVASRMLGENVQELNETVADVVGEITNIVTGGAKKILSQKGYSFDMAIPTTVLGKGHTVYHRSNKPVIVVPFETEVGNFFMELCFDP